MDRRAFMMTGAWLSAAAGALPSMTHAAMARHMIAVVDASLAVRPGVLLDDTAHKKYFPPSK